MSGKRAYLRRVGRLGGDSSANIESGQQNSTKLNVTQRNAMRYYTAVPQHIRARPG